MENLNLSEKVAIITGGASGIGYSTTQILLEQGIRCTIWDFDEQKGLESISHLSKFGEVKFQKVDISSETSVQIAIQNFTIDVGNPNILINSAGILGEKAELWNLSLEKWEKVIKNNLIGCFLVCKYVVPYIIKTDYGRIVNVASVSGKDGSIYASHYSAAKAGIIALTKSLSKELAKYNILVNCITPSATNTPLFRSESSADRERQIQKIPLNRYCEPREVAQLILWLVSNNCSFSTGAVFDISGGRSTY
jgi:3-oxoacyl-[acyl-carrier protein] reductase